MVEEGGLNVQHRHNRRGDRHSSGVLALELIATGINEVIASFLRWRARDLEQALKELLETGLTTALYNHGLIQSFTVRYSLWEKVLQRVSGAKGPQYRRPSYIPSHTFALASLDAIPAYIKALPANSIDTPEKQEALAIFNARPPNVAPVPPAGADPSAIAAASSALLTDLKSILESAKPFLPADLYQSLHAIVNDHTVSGINDAISNIEQWFDNMMQRVSSLYKAKVQHFLLVIGLILSVAINADSITIGNVLWHNGPLRDSVVAAAEEIAKENVLSPPVSSTGVVTPTPVFSGSLGLTGLPLILQIKSPIKR